MTEQTIVPVNQELIGARPELVERLRAAVATVPEPEPDAWLGILEQLLAAEEAIDLNKPWETDGLKAYLDKPLKVISCHRMPSDYAEGIGFYLVLQAVDNLTGEKITTTTGSVSVCVQLARAVQRGWLPMTVIPKEAERETSKGYHPQHLEVVAVREKK